MIAFHSHLLQHGNIWRGHITTVKSLKVDKFIPSSSPPSRSLSCSALQCQCRAASVEQIVRVSQETWKILAAARYHFVQQGWFIDMNTTALYIALRRNPTCAWSTS